MQRLINETKAARKKIAWGPERGWTDFDEDEINAPMVYELKSMQRDPVDSVSLQVPSLFGP
jgi:hypothetical protein